MNDERKTLAPVLKTKSGQEIIEFLDHRFNVTTLHAPLDYYGCVKLRPAMLLSRDHVVGLVNHLHAWLKTGSFKLADESDPPLYGLHNSFVSDVQLSKAMDKLIKEHIAAESNLTRDQLIECLFQAVVCGDFIRQIVATDNRQAMVYIPFAREQELEAKIKSLQDEVKSLQEQVSDLEVERE